MHSSKKYRSCLNKTKPWNNMRKKYYFWNNENHFSITFLCKVSKKKTFNYFTFVVSYVHTALIILLKAKENWNRKQKIKITLQSLSLGLLFRTDTMLRDTISWELSIIQSFPTYKYNIAWSFMCLESIFDSTWRPYYRNFSLCF